jgi:hypothetical protein
MQLKQKSNNYNATTGLLYDISEKTSVNASGTMRTFDNDSNISNIDINFLEWHLFSLKIKYWKKLIWLFKEILDWIINLMIRDKMFHYH